jgi:hypothetical protein
MEDLNAAATANRAGSAGERLASAAMLSLLITNGTHAARRSLQVDRLGLCSWSAYAAGRGPKIRSGDLRCYVRRDAD